MHGLKKKCEIQRNIQIVDMKGDGSDLRHSVFWYVLTRQSGIFILSEKFL